MNVNGAIAITSERREYEKKKMKNKKLEGR